MMRKFLFTSLFFSALSALCAADIALPREKAPSAEMTLSKALALRRTDRTYVPGKKLSLKQLSFLCYAACGFNREDRLTIPTARNVQDLILYLALPEGVYRYDAGKHHLFEVLKGDYRADFGMQKPMFRNASAVFIYVSDYRKFAKGTKENIKTFFAASHAGSAYQDVYLACAAEGLGTVVCYMVPRESAGKLLKLSEDEHILYAQPVGFPAVSKKGK